MFTESFLDTGGVNIRLRAGFDPGPPLLFLHGLSRDSRDFVSLIPMLTGSWQVHTLDHRGHGQSGRAPGAYRLTDYANDVAAVVRGFPAPVVLFGHSLGAATAAHVAAAVPEQVRAVILEDPPSSGFLADLTRTPYHAQFTAVQKLAGQVRPTAEIARDLANIELPRPNGNTVRLGDVRDPTGLRYSASCLPSLDPGVFDSVLDGSWFHGYDEVAIWKAIKCPVLLLRGEELRGGMLPATDADRMTATITDCSRVDVPGVGHLVHWMATEACVRLMLGFLQSV